MKMRITFQLLNYGWTIGNFVIQSILFKKQNWAIYAKKYFPVEHCQDDYLWKLANWLNEKII